MYWDIPKMWPGETVYIIGGGPSLVGQDLCLRHGLEGYLRNKRCIACNDSIYLGPDWIDMLWFCDYEWYYYQKIVKYRGIVAHCSIIHIEDASRHLCRLKRGKEFGIDTRPSTVSWNNSAGNAAINLAYHLGAARIVLLGFDAGETVVGGNRQTNWYPRKGKQHRSTWGRFLKAYPAIKADANRLGLEILNATPGSRITQFPFVKLEEMKNRTPSSIRR